MASSQIFKVAALPSTFIPNGIYILTGVKGSSKIYVATSDGTSVRQVTDIVEILNSVIGYATVPPDPAVSDSPFYRNQNTGEVYVRTGLSPTDAYQLLNSGSFPSFQTVPLSNQGSVITVTTPHFRSMIWNGTAYVRAPWHQPGEYAYNISSSATGYLPCRADISYLGTDYPDLAAKFTLVNGRFTLPEGRGRVLRATDNGIGLDPSRARGTLQGDAIRNIYGGFGAAANGAARYLLASSGAFSAYQNDTSLPIGVSQPSSDTNRYASMSFDASLIVPTAPENRMVNLSADLFVSY